MGGYDSLLFKENEKLPSTPKKLWIEFNKRMFKSKRYGGSKKDFNFIWYNEDSTFRVFWVDVDKDGDNGLWGVLDW